MKPVRAAAASLDAGAGQRAGRYCGARPVEDLCDRRRDEVTALKNLDFEIYDGEFVSVVGQSGCGKSTLLKVLAGLLPYTAGSVELNGKPLRGPSPEAAVVFQSPVLLPWRTVLENVLLPIEFRKLALIALPAEGARSAGAGRACATSRSAIRSSCQAACSSAPRSCRALVQDPRLLLMDEPFGALDAMTREQMNLELMRIWSGSRKTVFFITHSIAEAIFLSDRVIAMTTRPGSIADVIAIDLPRPRDLSIINTDRFGRYAAHLRSLLDAQGGMF